MDQSASSPSICCYAELAASFVNFLHYCLLSSRFCDAGKYSRGRCTDSASGCRPIRTIGAPTSLIPPFLSQRSQFIQAGYRYRIMLACRPSGLVSICLHCLDICSQCGFGVSNTIRENSSISFLSVLVAMCRGIWAVKL